MVGVREFAPVASVIVSGAFSMTPVPARVRVAHGAVAREPSSAGTDSGKTGGQPRLPERRFVGAFERHIGEQRDQLATPNGHGEYAPES